MRIVTREQLMALPAGTVFSHYHPRVFEGLEIKDSEPGWLDGIDFLVSNLIGAVESSGTEEWHYKLDQMEGGRSMPADFENSGRDGKFDHAQLYAVYERADVEKLIKRLQDTLKK